MEFGEYVQVLLRRKGIMIASVVVFLVAAVVITYAQPEFYEAEALLDISSEVSVGESASEVSETQIGTQVELIRRRLLPNDDLPSGLTRTELERRVKVGAVAQTEIISVKVSDRDPKRAAELSNAIAEDYLSWSRTTRMQNLKIATEQFEKRLSALSEQATSTAPAYEYAYSQLAQQLEQLRVENSIKATTGRIAVPATPPIAPSSPRPFANIALGLAFGLLVGAAAAFSAERRDQSIRSVDQIEEIYEAPVLGRIVSEAAPKDTPNVPVLTDPSSRVAETYRMLRNALTPLAQEYGVEALVVTSAFADEGKSSVTSNLAVSLAKTGASVAVVSCDFRHPSLATHFELTDRAGLSEALRGDRALEQVLHQVNDLSLWVISSGTMPGNPSELLGSSAMKDMIDTLKRRFDWVILDTPPLLAFSDTSALAGSVDGVLMVARDGVSTGEGARLSMEILKNVRARVLGVVSVRSGVDAGAPYGYGHGYAGYSTGRAEQQLSRIDGAVKDRVSETSPPS